MRLKSSAVWYDLPGIEAAYMPIGAPSAVDALMNVGRTDALGNHRMAGRYTATSGVLPTWSAATGWTGGSSAYLNTGLAPTSGSWSILARFKNASINEWPIGSYNHAVATSYCAIRPYTASGLLYAWSNQNVLVQPSIISGIVGLAGNQPYRNGVTDVSPITGTWTGAATFFFLLARSLAGNTPNGYFTGSVSFILIASRTLTPAEMWLCSHQMKYADVNPDWDAWARRRMYFYAPSAAAGRVGIYGARGAVALPGGVRIQGGNHG